MAGQLRSGFQDNVFSLPISSIVPQRAITASIRRSAVFRQIKSSVQEVGLIEPVVVFPHGSKNFLLLDGHIRVEILRELGISEVRALVSTDDEAYTYNKRVNHIPPVAQHFMLLQALNSGVPEQRIAAALNVDTAAIRKRAKLLDGICPEVVSILRDRKISAALFPILRKMKPAIQIATVEIMALRNDFTLSFAKTRLALTPPDLLVEPGPRKANVGSTAAQMLIEEDIEVLIRNLKRVEDSYGADILTLSVACRYIERLLGHPKIIRYLERSHSDVLETLREVVSAVHPSGKLSTAA